MEGTKLGRMVRGRSEGLATFERRQTEDGVSGCSPQLFYSIPLHHSTHRVLVLAGEVGTPAVVSSSDLLPLATCSPAHSLVSFKPDFDCSRLKGRCSAGVTLLLFELTFPSSLIS